MKVRSAWKRIDALTAVAILLLVTGTIFSTLGYLQSYRTLDLRGLVENLFGSLGIEFVSIAITVLVIDRLAFKRQKRRDELHLKSELIAKASSGVRETAVAAIGELARRGWLYDGTLREADLIDANLKGTVLHSTFQGGAELEAAHLKDADLSDMRLNEVNLQQAELQRARLSGARLVNANLQGANLDFADLEGAYLFLADLEGAHLYQTNIKDAIFWNANLWGVSYLTDSQLASASRLRDATMPDGRRYDGRYNLAGDIQDAKEDGIDVDDDESMAAWYGVALIDYQKGQKQEVTERKLD